MTVEEMASAYVQHVRRWQPVGPYSLVGYSFGGLVAFEMARLLMGSGQEVELVGLLDTNLHKGCLTPFERLKFRMLRGLYRATAHVRSPRSRILAAARD